MDICPRVGARLWIFVLAGARGRGRAWARAVSWPSGLAAGAWRGPAEPRPSGKLFSAHQDFFVDSAQEVWFTVLTVKEMVPPG